jgi:hypothetical protein
MEFGCFRAVFRSWESRCDPCYFSCRITETVEFVTPAGVEIENGRYVRDANRFEDFVGFVVDPYFLQKSFTIGGHEALKEFGESDDMD